MYAAYARLLTSFSITKFELLLHTQGSNADFCTWALKLKDIISLYPKLENNMKGIIERGIEDTDDFLLTEIRLNAISSCVLNYTSSTEYFLVDLIKFKLKDTRLLKRALDLKELTIRKFDIADFDNIDELREKYILQLSKEFSFGTLWTKKIHNASKLFDLPFDTNSKVLKSIDSVWELRNRFAHLNRMHHLPLEFTALNNDSIKIDNLKSNKEYLDFCVELIEVMNENLELIETFQQKVRDKWLKK